jgi:hypothetical protein
MAETIIDKSECSICGADVRENTQFCYNCGKSINDDAAVQPDGATKAEVIEDRAKDALDDLAAKLRLDEAQSEDKLARAAEERKKARVERRRTKEYRWEPVEAGSAIRLVLVALLIAGLVLLIVVGALWWR